MSVLYRCSYGTTETGKIERCSDHGRVYYLRRDTWTAKDSDQSEITTVHAAGLNDDSPAVNSYAAQLGHFQEPGAVAYNGTACSWCYLGACHTVEAHERAIADHYARQAAQATA